MTICILVRTEDRPKFMPKDLFGGQAIIDWIAAYRPVLYACPEQIRWQEGLLVVDGWMPSADGRAWIWLKNQRLCGVHNRFPLSRDPQAIHRIAFWCEQSGTPYANHPVFQEKVRDKWWTAQVWNKCHIPTPSTILDSTEMLDALVRWGRAYLKPRYGAFGEGILYLECQTDEIHIEGLNSMGVEQINCEQWPQWWQGHNFVEGEWILQQAIAMPSSSWRGCAIRTLIQRVSSDHWRHYPRVIRLSISDPVANVSRGAEVQPMEDLCSALWGQQRSLQIIREAGDLERRIARSLLDAIEPSLRDSVIEMGIDLLLDPSGALWALEVNGFPQGRLQQLAAFWPERFAVELNDINCLPLTRLCELMPHGVENAQATS